MTKIRYVMVTRFNIAVKYKSKKFSTTIPDIKPWLDRDYLKKRFDLFDKYTFPSVYNQTDKDFIWLVLFHKDTPNEFVELIDNYRAVLPAFTPCFLNDEESYDVFNFVSDYIREIQDGGDIRVISSRVDNDDVIHHEFVKTTKEYLSKSKDTMFLSYENGFQYEIATRYCTEYCEIGNHFLAMITGTKDVNSILSAGDHDQVMKTRSDDVKTIVKTKIPMWCEIISDSNCINSLRWGGWFTNCDMAKAFPELPKLWNNRLEYCGRSILNIFLYARWKLSSVVKYGRQWRRG